MRTVHAAPYLRISLAREFLLLADELIQCSLLTHAEG
jgi:hypothetical protein